MNKNEWIKAVLKRDNNRCRSCKKATSNVTIISSSETEIYEVSNGLSMCLNCEKEYKSLNDIKSDWGSMEKFLNSKGQTLRQPILYNTNKK